MSEIIEQEQILIDQALIYCGVDEAGAGPLCGDVVAAAVVLDPNNPIDQLNDSKKLSEKKREMLFPIIKEKALAYCIARCSAQEIDDINILNARMLAMTRAIEGLNMQIQHALIDGNRLPKDLPCAGTAIVKGDALVASISAASVLAKVQRDHDMVELDKQYPQYGLAKHKGYPTKAHLEALQEYGPTEIYRKTYGPVKKLLNEKTA
jgi:ribonuclease HII